MQWSYKAKELMQNQCRTGKIYTPPGGDIQNQEKEHIAFLGKIYTGEKRRNKLLGKKDKGDGEKRNIISYGNGRFLPPLSKISFGCKRKLLFLNILPISLFLVISRYTHFPLIRTLSLFPNLFSPEWKGLCFKTSFKKNHYSKDKKAKGDVC